MDSAISSDPVVILAFRSGLGAVALTLLMLLYIGLLRVLYRRRERRKREFMSKWGSLLSESALTDDRPIRLPAIEDGEVIYYLAYWNHQYISVSDTARARLNALAASIDIGPAVRRMLHKGSSAEKLLATIGIGFFGNKTDIPALKKLLVSERSIDCLHAASAMLRIDAATLYDVLPILARRSDISTAGIANVLKGVDMESVSRVLGEMLEGVLHAEGQQRIRRRDIVRQVMLTATALPSVVNPHLRKIMDSTEDDEVLTACLKVMRDPQDIDRIRGYVAHPNWGVRVQAATALGDMGEEKDMTLLLQLLSDSQWWVRYRAAQAISALPFVTRSTLEELKKELSDGFAIDMLDQIISERAS